VGAARSLGLGEEELAVRGPLGLLNVSRINLRHQRERRRPVRRQCLHRSRLETLANQGGRGKVPHLSAGGSRN